ncbi:MAG: PHP domain-containing protein [Oscillospiraceae bacterium]|jgi:hypothetical protein|nr:PHP domain-containing protein [Oscillospiraceae bacterium]
MTDPLVLLNAPTAAERLENLRALLPGLALPPVNTDVNNHIHTTYSFSPYSPTAAAYRARMSGLCTAGIMDHDSLAGAREFLAACELLGIGGTCGVECRVTFEQTPLAGRRINNPDQPGIAYMLLHAMPHDQIEEADAFFAPLRERRNDRNRRMIARLNELLTPVGISLDFDRDVWPLSEAANGGSVTERHIASALAHALERTAGRGAGLIAFLERLGKPVGASHAKLLTQAENLFFHYDLIGWIKAELIPAFYIPATDECADVRDVLALGERLGAISAYAYLGDVGESPTGDKRAQQFEDSYLDELFDTLDGLGFRAITYMPTRNTPEQLTRLRSLIHARGYFEISGEDINQPRQAFVCLAMRGAGFDALRESAWAMIGSERAADSLFSAAAAQKCPDQAARVATYAQMGRESL